MGHQMTACELILSSTQTKRKKSSDENVFEATGVLA